VSPELVRPESPHCLPKGPAGAALTELQRQSLKVQEKQD
jgi:hypothetical protein